MGRKTALVEHGSDRRRRGTPAGLFEVAATIDPDLDLKAVLTTFCQKTAELCGVDRCFLFLLRENVLVPAMAQYADARPRPALGKAFEILRPYRVDEIPAFRRALSEGDPVLVDHEASRDGIPADWEALFGIRAALVVPLVRDRRIVGVMSFDNCTSLRAFDEGDLDTARAMAGHVALLVDNARVADEVRSRLAATETMLSIGKTVGSTLDLMEVARRISRAAALTVGADSAGILLKHDTRTGLQPLAGYHVPAEYLAFLRGDRFASHSFTKLGQLLGPATQSLWSDDVRADPRLQDEVIHQLAIQSILLTAICARNERLGVLVCAWWKDRHRFEDKDLSLVEGIADQAAMAIVNARLYAKAEELATQRERVRMARELHDRLSQGVFSIGLTLDWCLHQVSPESELSARLQQVKREATLVMADMRQLIYQLSPETAPRADFALRFRRLVENFRELGGIAVDYRAGGNFASLGGSQQDVLLKTFQEGFANIVKHSRARRVTVILDIARERVSFELTDDGVGFPGISEGDVPLGVGLTQMIRRIRAGGGDVDLRANVPSGLTVAGWLPIEHDG